MRKVFAWVTVSAVALSLILFFPLSVSGQDFQEPDYPPYAIDDEEHFYERVYLPVMEYYYPEVPSFNPYHHELSYYLSLSSSSYEIIAYMTKDIVRTGLSRVHGSYQAGYNLGYEDGKADGMTDDFSLKEMIFSIFDAPFRVVREALNFELFGVEVSSLVLGLLSVVLVIFVIRRIKG